MSRFLCQYLGSKRGEAAVIVEHAPELLRAETVVEPFGGSAALTVSLYTDHEKIDTKFVVNDLDPGLVAFLRWFAENGLDGLVGQVAGRSLEKVRTLEHPGLAWFVKAKTTSCGFAKKKADADAVLSFKPTRRHREGEAFWRSENVWITSEDWKVCVARYMDDTKACVYLDPPYFASFNGKYHGYEQKTNGGLEKDLTQMFVDILRMLEGARCAVVMSTSGCALLRKIYRPWLRHTYVHEYGLSCIKTDAGYKRKKAEHLLVAKAPDVDEVASLYRAAVSSRRRLARIDHASAPGRSAARASASKTSCSAGAAVVCPPRGRIGALICVIPRITIIGAPIHEIASDTRLHPAGGTSASQTIPPVGSPLVMPLGAAARVSARATSRFTRRAPPAVPDSANVRWLGARD